MRKILRNTWYVVIAGMMILIDRITKWWALKHCMQLYYISSPIFSCHLAFNRGLSWGILNSTGTFPFIFVTLLVALVTIAIGIQGLYRLRLGNNILPEVLVVAGSLSNLIDRFVYGGVIDFIVLSYAGWTFPYFNCADIAIVVGAFLLLVRTIREL